MSLHFALDPELTDALGAELLTLWTDVSNAGGAVGFVPPVTEDDVRATAARELGCVGTAADLWADRLLVAREAATGRLAGVLFFESLRVDLMEHWRLLKRVMVHPDFQGRGYGVQLMAQAELVAREWGLAGLRLTARGGQGLERFYQRCGYREVGRTPGAIRVAVGDDRDEITFWLELRS